MSFPTTGKVGNPFCFQAQAHLHSTDPDGVLPLVETLQTELLNPRQVPHDRVHGPEALVKSLAFILCLYCELIVFVNDAFAGFTSGDHFQIILKLQLY